MTLLSSLISRRRQNLAHTPSPTLHENLAQIIMIVSSIVAVCNLPPASVQQGNEILCGLGDRLSFHVFDFGPLNHPGSLPLSFPLFATFLLRVAFSARSSSSCSLGQRTSVLTQRTSTPHAAAKIPIPALMNTYNQLPSITSGMTHHQPGKSAWNF